MWKMLHMVSFTSPNYPSNIQKPEILTYTFHLGASICAERTTICSAVIQKENKFKAIGISSDLDEVITPCGICRQFIREFGKKIPIFMFKKNGEFIKMYLEDLLPFSFGPEQLS